MMLATGGYDKKKDVAVDDPRSGSLHVIGHVCGHGPVPMSRAPDQVEIATCAAPTLPSPPLRPRGSPPRYRLLIRSTAVWQRDVPRLDRPGARSYGLPHDRHHGVGARDAVGAPA